MTIVTYSCPRLNYHLARLCNKDNNGASCARSDVIIEHDTGDEIRGTNCDFFSTEDEGCTLSVRYAGERDFPKQCNLKELKKIK